MFDLNSINGKWNIVESTDECYLKDIDRKLSIRFRVKKKVHMEFGNGKEKKLLRFNKKIKRKNGVAFLKRKFLFLNLPTKLWIVEYNDDSEWLIIARGNSLLKKLQIDVLTRRNELSGKDILEIRKKISSNKNIAGYLKFLKNVN